MLYRCFKDECIAINQSLSNKKNVLKLVAELAKKNELLKNISVEEIYEGLQNREKMGSTGFENGIAIPHCTLKGITDFVVGLITVPDGVEYDSFDKKPAEIIFFIIAPAEKRNEHIRLLSQISNVLHDKFIKNELFSAKDISTLKENLFRHVTIDLDKEKIKKYQQFTVIIQNENIFEDILRVLSETNECNISVIEGSNALSYLETQPLFSSFWNEKAKGFNRIIIAIVKNSLSNDTIRKLNFFISHEESEASLMFTVQEVFYMNGNLNL